MVSKSSNASAARSVSLRRNLLRTSSSVQFSRRIARFFAELVERCFAKLVWVAGELPYRDVHGLVVGLARLKISAGVSVCVSQGESGVLATLVLVG